MDAAYETFLYENLPISDTHPDWLGLLGHLVGMHPAPATACRVLALGCGLGGNLLALADVLPQSQFVGVDLAQAQIAQAQADAAAMGLSNIRFEAMDLSDIPTEWGAFDYIICHGVYSWVPPTVQRRILEICRDHLAPQGMALVSYNTLPGWHARGMFREMLARVVPTEASAPQRAGLARQFLRFLRDTAPKNGSLTPWVRRDLDLILSHTDRYLFFEFLAADNHPCYFGDFMRAAIACDLQYAGDAELQSGDPAKLGPKAPAAIAEWTTEPLQIEQLADYAGGRFFRRTLLCRAEVTLAPRTRPSALEAAWFATGFTPNADHTPIADGMEAAFTMPDGYVVSTTDAMLKATLLELSAHRPGGLALAPLVAGVAHRLGTSPDAALRERVLEHLDDMLNVGRLEAGRWARPVAITVPERPQALRWARRQASQGHGEATNLHHETVVLDKLDRVLVEAMDGSRDEAALVAVLAEALQAGRLQITLNGAPLTDPGAMTELVAVKLRQLVKKALVLG
jgi:SAM-dependent methyltransferase